MSKVHLKFVKLLSKKITRTEKSKGFLKISGGIREIRGHKTKTQSFHFGFSRTNTTKVIGLSQSIY